MLTGDEPTQEPSQTHFTSQQSFTDNNFFPQPPSNNTFYHHQHPHNAPSLFDPRAYGGASPYAPSHHPSMLSMDQVSSGGGGGYFVFPKSEEVSRPIDFASRIGLNLGGRTYFSSADDDFVNRLYRRSRPGEPGLSNSPRCQAQGCNADLTQAKHYHRRHKVCEFHSKASTVIAAGLTQRFCQQCSRFFFFFVLANLPSPCIFIFRITSVYS